MEVGRKAPASGWPARGWPREIQGDIGRLHAPASGWPATWLASSTPRKTRSRDWSVRTGEREAGERGAGERGLELMRIAPCRGLMRRMQRARGEPRFEQSICHRAEWRRGEERFEPPLRCVQAACICAARCIACTRRLTFREWYAPMSTPRACEMHGRLHACGGEGSMVSIRRAPLREQETCKRSEHGRQGKL